MDTSCEPPAPVLPGIRAEGRAAATGCRSHSVPRRRVPATATTFLGAVAKPRTTGTTAPADGKPCVAGALTAIVAGEEELRSWAPRLPAELVP